MEKLQCFVAHSPNACGPPILLSNSQSVYLLDYGVGQQTIIILPALSEKGSGLGGTQLRHRNLEQWVWDARGGSSASEPES